MMAVHIAMGITKKQASNITGRLMSFMKLHGTNRCSQGSDLKLFTTQCCMPLKLDRRKKSIYLFESILSL